MIGERLKKLRNERNLTQEEAAKRLGIVRSTYSNYESGKREPDFDTTKLLANFFEVSVDYLLGKTESRFTNDQARNAAIEAYNRLPPEKKKLIDDMIRALTDQ